MWKQFIQFIVNLEKNMPLNRVYRCVNSRVVLKS